MTAIERLVFVSIFEIISSSCLEKPYYHCDETFDYDSSLFNDVKISSTIDDVKTISNFFQLAVETALNNLHNIQSGHQTGGDNSRSIMGSLETVFRESYKFIRLTDDLHIMKDILSDIRICFIALTISVYVGILLYVLVTCITRRQAETRRNKEDELLFGKWSGHRSPSIRQPELYRDDELGEITTFYCPRPQTLVRGGNYMTSTLERQQTKPLLTESFSATPSPLTGSTVRENGGIIGGERISMSAVGERMSLSA